MTKLCPDCHSIMKIGKVIKHSNERYTRYLVPSKHLKKVDLINCWKCPHCGCSVIDEVVWNPFLN